MWGFSWKHPSNCVGHKHQVLGLPLSLVYLYNHWLPQTCWVPGSAMQNQNEHQQFKHQICKIFKIYIYHTSAWRISRWTAEGSFSWFPCQLTSFLISSWPRSSWMKLQHWQVYKHVTNYTTKFLIIRNLIFKLKCLKRIQGSPVF